MLRLRRHVRGQERRHLDGDALGQAAADPRHPRRGLHGGRQLVPDAHRRRAAQAADRRARDAPGRDPGGDGMQGLPGGGAARRCRTPSCAATSARRRRRSAPSGCARSPSCPTGRQLREAGAAIKARAMATLPEQLERLEAAVTRAGGTVHWARDGAEATAIVGAHRRGQGHARGDQGQVAGHGRDRPQRGPARARDRGDRDRPGGADHPARRRQAVAHPRPRDPLEPGRDQGAVRAHDRRGAGPRLGGDGDRRGRAQAPAREVPDRARRGLRRELRHRRDGHDLRRRVRGQRAHVHDAARDADHA